MSSRFCLWLLCVAVLWGSWAVALSESLQECELNCQILHTGNIENIEACQTGCQCTDLQESTGCSTYCQDFTNTTTAEICETACVDRNLCRSLETLSYTACYAVCETDYSNTARKEACIAGCRCDAASSQYEFCDEFCTVTNNETAPEGGGTVGDKIEGTADGESICLDACAARNMCPEPWPSIYQLGGLSVRQKSTEVNLVINSTTIEAFVFTGAETEVTYVDAFVSTLEPSLELEWLYRPTNTSNPSTEEAEYTLYLQWDYKDVLTDITVSIPTTGNLSASTFEDFSLHFECSTYAEVTVLVAVAITDSDTTENVFFQFTKDCFPPSCEGLCLHGNCSLTGDGVEFCDCDSGYDALPFCEFGFFAGQAEYCPGDNVDINWNWEFSGISGLDWISIVRPDQADPLQERDYAELSPYLLTEHEFLWAYLDGSQDVDEENTDTTSVGDWNLKLNLELPGRYSFMYFVNDRYELRALSSFVLLAKDDPQCLSAAATLVCDRGTLTVDPVNTTAAYCDCDPGFFGALCDLGCAPVTTLEGWGGTIESSINLGNEYANNANCKYDIIPSTDFEAKGYSIIFTALKMDRHDMIHVYNSSSSEVTSDTVPMLTVNGGDNSNALIAFDQVDHLSFEFQSNSLYASWPQIGMFGWQLIYFSKGCPAGNKLQNEVIVSLTPGKLNGRNISCISCPAGTYSTLADSAVCEYCPAHFVSGIGATECEECEAGYFAPEEGSSSCSLCSDYGFPEPCDPNPNLNPAEFAGALTGLLIGYVIVFGAMIMVIIHRKDKIIFSASPLFLMLTLTGLVVGLVVGILNVMEQTSFICNFKQWLFNIAFQLVFGPIFVKTYRLHKIFNNPLLRAVTVKNSQLIMWVLGMVLVDAVVMVVWSTFSPYYILSEVEPVCVSDDNVVFLWVLFAWHCVIFIYGMYLTYKVKNVPSLYNESFWIGATMYNFFAISIVFGVLYNTSSNLGDATFRLYVSLMMIYTSISVVVLLFCPKFYYNHLERQQVKSGPKISRSTTSMTVRSTSYISRAEVEADMQDAISNRETGEEFDRAALKDKISTEVRFYTRLVKKINKDEELSNTKKDKIAYMQAHYLYVCSRENVDAEEYKTAADDVFEQEESKKRHLSMQELRKKESLVLDVTNKPRSETFTTIA